ncbi:MAG: hypothetical protein ACRDMX_08830 [Solirubrobacteraceae bacterium]
MVADSELSHAELREQLGQARKIPGFGRGAYVNVLGRPNHAVRIHGESADQNVVDAGGVELSEEAAWVERRGHEEAAENPSARPYGLSLVRPVK